MTCKCKLPIIRGYEPELYCLQCGLNLKNKTMKKLKDVIKLKKGYRYLSETGNFETTFDYWILTKKVDLWITNCGLHKFSETTIRENEELFEDIYESERKKICVEIEYDNSDKYEDLDVVCIKQCMTSDSGFIEGSRNIKVTEVKPLIKEDAEWFYNAGWRRPCNNFNSLWAEFQAKKEAENG